MLQSFKIIEITTLAACLIMSLYFIIASFNGEFGVSTKYNLLAKEKVLELSKNYMPPSYRDDIYVLGRGGVSVLYSAINEFRNKLDYVLKDGTKIAISEKNQILLNSFCLLYTSPSPRD